MYSVFRYFVIRKICWYLFYLLLCVFPFIVILWYFFNMENTISTVVKMWWNVFVMVPLNKFIFHAEMFIIIYMLLVILCQSLIFTEGLSTINGIDELV